MGFAQEYIGQEIILNTEGHLIIYPDRDYQNSQPMNLRYNGAPLRDAYWAGDKVVVVLESEDRYIYSGSGYGSHQPPRWNG